MFTHQRLVKVKTRETNQLVKEKEDAEIDAQLKHQLLQRQQALQQYQQLQPL